MQILQVVLALIFLCVQLLKVDNMFIVKTSINHFGARPISNLLLVLLILFAVGDNVALGIFSLILVVLLLSSLLVFIRLERKELSLFLCVSLLLLPVLYFIKLGSFAVNMSSASLVLFVVFILKELHVFKA